MLDWEQLEQSCMSCFRCNLCGTRNKVVFGVGPRDADVLFVGEGPGQQEDLIGEPFVGAAGKYLDEILNIIDLGRHNCYIANVVKCRPPNNRDPLPEEQEACIDYLRNQFALIRPKLLICLGRVAATRLIRPDFRITKEHGTWHRKGNVWMTAIYHPSALLRDPSKRPEAFRDLMGIREMIRRVGAKV